MKYGYCLIIWLLGIGSSLLSAQSGAVQHYTTTAGLPQSHLTTVYSDYWGYIWVGTQSAGLSRFDGEQFENFGSQHGLPDLRIRAFYQDEQRIFWIGTLSGLVRFDGQNFQRINGVGTLVQDILTDETGQLWVATGKGLYYLEKSTLRYEPQLGPIPIYAIARGNQEVLWIGTQKGLYQYQADKLRYFGPKQGFPQSAVRSLAKDQKGNLYIAYQNGDHYQWNGDQLKPFSSTSHKGSPIQTLLPFSEQKIAIGTTNQGVQFYQKDQEKIEQPVSLQRKSFQAVQALTLDRWNQLWIGTTNGLVRYSEQTYSPFELLPSLAQQNIKALHATKDQQLWIGTDQGIARYKNKIFTPYTELPSLTPLALLEDQRGRLWIGTERNGLAMYDEKAFYFVGSTDELGDQRVTDILQDSSGSLWVATAKGGISQLIPSPGDSSQTTFQFQQYPLNQDAQQIEQLLLDKEGRMWYASTTGIGYLQADSSWVHFTTNDGLPEAPVRMLTTDDNGYLWGATAGQGIFRCRLQQGYISVQTYRRAQGLSSDNIYQIQFDRRGQLWLGHQNGVDRVQLDFYDVITDVQSFGKAEGFAGIETTAKTIWESESQELFFGTTNGLVRYTPGKDQSNDTPPRIALEQVRLFYAPLETTDYAAWSIPQTGLREGLILPHDQNHLSFRFKAINLVAPQKIRYQFQLIGADRDWSPVTEQNQATYPNLSPGDYTFQIKAINEDSISSVQPLQLSFSIQPALWQRTWFRWGIGLAVLGLLLRLNQIRIRRIRRDAQAEKIQLETDKQLLRLEQKALQLQMNPHFIFNALGSIQHLIGQQNPKAARYQLAKFSKLMRSILEHSRSEKISLADEIELLDNYLGLEQFTRNQSFQFEFKILEDIDPEVVQLPPMMIQPFLENAVIHGVAHVEQGVITIEFTRKFNILRCTIRDNGIGREKAAQLKSQRAEQHKSVALSVTRERLKALAPNDQRLGFDIHDLEVGTEVVIRLPIL